MTQMPTLNSLSLSAIDKRLIQQTPWQHAQQPLFWEASLSAKLIRRAAFICQQQWPEAQSTLAIQPPLGETFNRYAQELAHINQQLNEPVIIEEQPFSMSIADWLYVEMVIQTHFVYKKSASSRSTTPVIPAEALSAMKNIMANMHKHSTEKPEGIVNKVKSWIGLTDDTNQLLTPEALSTLSVDWHTVMVRNTSLDQLLITSLSSLLVAGPSLPWFDIPPLLVASMTERAMAN